MALRARGRLRPVEGHGGRQLHQARRQLTIDVLPEIVEAVGGRARILVDGGMSRGTDVVKALILGADAVACGQLSAIYGLAATAGKRRACRASVEILEDEITASTCRANRSITSCSRRLDKSYIRPARQVAQPHVHSAFPHLNLPRETY